MRIRIIAVLLLILFCSCTTSNIDEKKVIDTGVFKIEVPKNWDYKKGSGSDGIIGRIQTGFWGIQVRLHFDYSEQGVANSLIPSLDEYLYQYDYKWKPLCAFCEKGTVYTSGSIEGTMRDIMERDGIDDPSLIKVEPYPKPKIQIFKHESSDIYEGYYAQLSFRDSIITVEIEIPDKIRNHYIEIDTAGNYRRKIIYPKSGKGKLTGVYFEDLNSTFNFNLEGWILGSDNQEKAINAFKSISFHRDKNEK